MIPSQPIQLIDFVPAPSPFSLRKAGAENETKVKKSQIKTNPGTWLEIVRHVMITRVIAYS